MHTCDDLTARFCRSCQLADGEGCLGWAESHAGVPDGEGHRAGVGGRGTGSNSLH